jgi:RNA polymerase sigma-70 factor (ECF subfamily)
MATPRDSPQESRDSPRGEPRRVDRAGEVSCNFPAGSRVVSLNDDLPVHKSEAGVAAPVDFTTFMRNYQDMVYSTAVRLTGNEAQAEDIAQEVFLKAYENYDHLAVSPTVGGWLKTVATNLSLNHLTRYRRRWRFFSEFRRDDEGDDRDAPPVEFAAPDTFFNGLEAEERRALVDAALAELPSHQRLPLVLFHFEEMPYDEIARKLGVSLAKVKTDILRARAALAKILQRPGSAHPELQA